MKRKYKQTEEHILKLFSNAKSFTFKSIKYDIKIIGKPRPKKGECKTDIYICALNKSNNQEEEFKISIKQTNADFLENKISYDRAIELFGSNASNIIQQSIDAIKNDFKDDYLIYLKKHKGTYDKSIKIGWKFEFVNKLSGNRSNKLVLSNQQKIDVYSGSSLCQEKKNSKVEKQQITDSGVANYILEVDENLSNDINYYIDKLQNIQTYAVKQDIYFACKAINFRVTHLKWDGDRPLAVFCKWFINQQNKLDVELIFDNPLQTKANEIGQNINQILKDLNITESNFNTIKNHISNSIKIYD